MSSVRQINKTWALTEEAFSQFLSLLHPNPAQAGEVYEKLRESLVKFLDWRGAHAPEELVDEAFNRVMRKLAEGETIQDVTAYCHGVARLVFLQSLERPEQRHVSLDEALPLAAPTTEPETIDQRRVCLKQCLQTLPPDSRTLIIEYYRDERRRKIDNRVTLAERLGIPLNALRNRAQRIRDKLEQCVSRCCRKNSAT